MALQLAKSTAESAGQAGNYTTKSQEDCCVCWVGFVLS